MIGYLSGVLQKKCNNFLLIQVGGVGYTVFVSLDLFAKAKEQEEIDLYVYTVVKENEISLYGFESLHERNFFELLISVSGIGPKSALEFFSVPLSLVKEAISAGDIPFLTKVKGVGKRTAERIVMELKNKLGTFVVSDIISSKESNESENEASDVILALEGLGFDRMLIVQKLKKAPSFSKTEEAVMWFLQNNDK